MKKFDTNLTTDIQNRYDSGERLRNLAKEYNYGLSTLKKYIKQGSQKKILSEEERKIAAVIAVNKRRRKVKQMAVEYKGGACQKCGYNSCVDALDFHHINESEKEFGIANKGHCWGWDKIKKELDKCILLCANCHREEHSESCNCLDS